MSTEPRIHDDDVTRSSASNHTSSRRRVVHKTRRSTETGDTSLHDARQLARLLAHDQVEATEMRRALVKVTDQLEQERRRTADAEARARTAEANVLELRAAKQVLLREIQRDRETLKNYQIQIEVARREINHAQTEINRLATEKFRAEEDAAKQRGEARRIQKDLEINLAIQQGRRQGYLDGREEGWRQARYNVEENGRIDEYDEEDDNEDEPPLPPSNTNIRSRQPPPRADYVGAARPPNATNPAGVVNNNNEMPVPQFPAPQADRSLYGDMGRSAMSPVRENASIRSRVSDALRMRNISSPIPIKGDANELNLSFQMPTPQSPSHQPGSGRPPSVRSLSRSGSVQSPPSRPPSERAASVRPASLFRRAVSTTAIPDGDIFVQPELNLQHTMPLPQMDPNLPTPITPEASLRPVGLSPKPPSLVVQAPTPPEGSVPFFSGMPYGAQEHFTATQPEIQHIDEYLSPKQGSTRSLSART